MKILTRAHLIKRLVQENGLQSSPWYWQANPKQIQTDLDSVQRHKVAGRGLHLREESQWGGWGEEAARWK